MHGKSLLVEALLILFEALLLFVIWLRGWAGWEILKLRGEIIWGMGTWAEIWVEGWGGAENWEGWGGVENWEGMGGWESAGNWSGVDNWGASTCSKGGVESWGSWEGVGKSCDGVGDTTFWAVGTVRECLGDWKTSIAALTTPLAHIFGGRGGVVGGVGVVMFVEVLLGAVVAIVDRVGVEVVKVGVGWAVCVGATIEAVDFVDVVGGIKVEGGGSIMEGGGSIVEGSKGGCVEDTGKVG
jgi:hypothetical protein